MLSFASREQRRERLLAVRVGGPLLERRRGQPRRDLSRLRAADAVGDSEQRRVADERVLVLRAAPAGVREGACASDPHASTLQIGLADPDDVARQQHSRRRDARAVDERPVRRPDVLDPEPVGARLQHRVAGRDEVVAVEPDRVLAAAAEPGRPRDLQRAARPPGRGCSSRADGRGALDDRLVARAERVRLVALDHDRLLWRRA